MRQPKLPIWIGLGFWLLLTQCVPDAGPPEDVPQSPFYDLQAFFEGEVKRLQAQQPSVEKTVSFDEATEVDRLDSMNYRQELKVFLDADINRPAWWDRYAIDSSRQDGALRSIRYQAKAEDLKIRSILLTFSRDSLRSVDIDLEAESAATGFRQELHYSPAKGFRIFTRQDVILSQPREMRVEVSFLP